MDDAIARHRDRVCDGGVVRRWHDETDIEYDDCSNYDNDTDDDNGSLVDDDDGGIDDDNDTVFVDDHHRRVDDDNGSVVIDNDGGVDHDVDDSAKQYDDDGAKQHDDGADDRAEQFDIQYFVVVLELHQHIDEYNHDDDSRRLAQHLGPHDVRPDAGWRYAPRILQLHGHREQLHRVRLQLHDRGYFVLAWRCDARFKLDGSVRHARTVEQQRHVRDQRSGERWCERHQYQQLTNGERRPALGAVFETGGRLLSAARVMRRCRIGLVLLFLLNATAAGAQSTAQVPLEFDFLNPGARSVGVGGAFSAVADDATAAFTNPAGLVQLVDREISFEPRLLFTKSRFLAGGRLSGVPTGLPPDTLTAPVYDSDVDTRLVPSFASAVFPSRKWAAALYYQQVTKTNNTLLDQGAFERVTFGNELTDRSRDDALEGTRRISVASIGTSVGWRVSPAFAVGAGVIVQRLSIDSAFARYGYATTIFGPFDRSRVDARQTQFARSWGLGWQLGATRTIGPTVRLGAVVRVGSSPKFEQVDSSAELGRVERHGRFRIPHVIAAGGIWQPRDNVAIIGELTRINYNRLKHDYVDFQTLATGNADRVRIDDGYEVHVGGEWTIVREPPRISPVVRFGTWFDPAHAVRYVPTGSTPGEIRLAAALPGTVGRWHYSGGLGVPVSRKLELHVGADVSSRSATLSVSTIVRFVKKERPAPPL